MVSAARFGQGMTFEQYVAFTATPDNLKREARPQARAGTRARCCARSTRPRGCPTCTRLPGSG
jgi:hypothetical protein